MRLEARSTPALPFDPPLLNIYQPFPEGPRDGSQSLAVLRQHDVLSLPANARDGRDHDSRSDTEDFRQATRFGPCCDLWHGDWLLPSMKMHVVRELGKGRLGWVRCEQRDDRSAGDAWQNSAVQRRCEYIEVCNGGVNFYIIVKSSESLPPSSRFNTTKIFIAPASVMASPSSHNTC